MNLVESLADHAKIDIWSMVPSLVDELGETPGVLAKFRSSKFICASGGMYGLIVIFCRETIVLTCFFQGPVGPITAGKVNETIRVLNLTGTTEGLFIGNLVVDRDDWLWFAFHPFSGFEFKEVEPGVYEHWVHRNEQWPLFQGIFHTFPAEQSINLKDLYIRHPTKPNLWAFKGRSDDIVVLSNGYKISPLDTEAFVTTHPAIDGCLMIGTGKPQAGLLIELKDPSSRDPEIFDSIWSTVQKTNELSLHKNQLHRDYITVSEVDKPFVRTDKGTVKRHATLTLYADYIERFYSSRGDDPDAVKIDTTSIESIMDSVRDILGSLLPAVYKASPDVDLFALGLDSLLVFRAVKAIRVAMGLRDQLAPRHLYASPTIAKFSAALARLAAGARKTAIKASHHSVNDDVARMKDMIDKNKARLPSRLNAIDYVNPNHYMGLNFFFGLRTGITFEKAFEVLRKGLRRTMQLVPALDGRIIICSDDEIGYKKGDLRLTIPPYPRPVPSDRGDDDSSTHLRQLLFKDMSQVLPHFQELRKAGFKPSAFNDEAVLGGPVFPPLPADVLSAQANFVHGGCILATNWHHSCLDGVGVMVALKVWAESCRYVQGDNSATCSWLDPECFNHSLPEILHEQEGYARPADEVDPGVWGFLPFLAPEAGPNALSNGISKTNGTGRTLPSPPTFPRKFDWPPPPAQKGLDTTMFLIPPEKVQKLQQEVIADPVTKGSITSISDITQAFLWRSAIRARYRVATELRGERFTPDEISILELPVDGRPYFSSLLPSSYMGSMLIVNRPNMPIETLCSPKTSIGRVAQILREAAGRITPSLVHDAFTLLQSLPDYSRFTNACMGLEGMHAMISNLILFQTSEVTFGEGLFADGGSPAAMRPRLGPLQKYFRFLVIFPMRDDGGVELVLGTSPEELEMLRLDKDFTRYAQFTDG
ncbi:MAG: hypothetical protein LQ350_005248 [Teloschistes chrysophthalmus]|nr:MAG: hypothetical protein LQ350_005248 [Niorma chrysophthalma]